MKLEAKLENRRFTSAGDNLDLKLKALSSSFRRNILGLVYVYGEIYQSDIMKHVEVDSNLLSYHLNLLCDADLIGRNYSRDGKNLSRYYVKEDGEKFLEFIGAKNKLKKITNKN